ncbi:MAG: ribosome rescue GTPase HflX [Pseudomonadota bacterium]
MFERYQGGERALLLHVALDGEHPEPDEFRELARSSGAEAVIEFTVRRHRPDPRTFIGSGKLEEVKAAVAAEGVELVLVDHALSPGQERNLEQALECRVLDRTGLILDIFAQRARSHEGKLQVELAQLRHMSTRLVRGWTHLERQKGGIGLRGPGETQLETDRRLLGERIKKLERRLEKVDRQRAEGRRGRQRAELPVVSLVGYTNAGKSTLFNALTTSEIYAADQLFATLDATLRRLELPRGISAVVADTVGFIRHLPHELVAAFRSTLQETREASLLLHVVDASDPERNDRIDDVNEVLEAVGASAIPQLLVYNKIDRLPGEEPHVERDHEGRPWRVWVSALDGRGLDDLVAEVAEQLAEDHVQCRLTLGPEQGRLRARLHELGAVRREEYEPSGDCTVEVEMPRRTLERLSRQEDFALEPCRIS